MKTWPTGAAPENMPIMSKPISIVRHPDYGTGEVLEVRPDPLPPCSCESCRVNPRPSHLMLVRWTQRRNEGVAGGWYDPMSERFTFENTVAIANKLQS